LNLQLRAIEATDQDERLAKLEKAVNKFGNTSPALPK